MMSAKQPDLPNMDQPWSVRVAIQATRSKKDALIRYDGTHKLLYRRVVIDRGTGYATLQKFIRQADLFNSRRATPETRSRCEDTTGALL